MDFAASSRMWLISAVVYLALMGVSFAAYATIHNTETIVVANGSDVTINCTLSGQLNGQHAADLRWQICTRPKDCNDITAHHTVQTLDNRTSQLHLRGLTMPPDPSDEGKYYLCSLDPTTVNSFTFVGSSVPIFVGIPPYPARNLRCWSRNTIRFTCTWEEGGYTGIRILKTYFQYREAQGDGNWNTEILDQKSDQLSFSGNASGSTMEIQVTQENRLGNSTVRTMFSVASETVPNPPSNVSLRFLQDLEDYTIILQLSWDLPKQWPQGDSYVAWLAYRIQYKYSTMEDFQTVGPRENDYSRRHTLDNVAPYTNYTVRVACQLSAQEHWSEWSPLVTGLSPESVPSGVVLSLSQQSLSTNKDPYKRNVLLTWQPPHPAERNGIIRGYMLNVAMVPRPIQINISHPSYQLEDLDKFQNYHVTVAAYTTEGAVGPAADIEIPDLTRRPAQVENVKVVSPASDSLNVTWDAPANPHGVILGYRVTWNRVGEPANIHRREVEPDATSALVPNLQPYSKYKIVIVRRNKNGFSLPAEAVAVTHFAKPSQPLNLQHQRSSPAEVELSWQKPEVLHGPLLGYEIHYQPNDGPIIAPTNKTVSVPHAPVTVNCSSLKEAAAPFTFRVRACTGTKDSDKICGPPAILEQTMCGLSSRDLKVTFGIAVPTIAFSIMLLAFCLRCMLHSQLAKSPPDPYFIDGILDTNCEKFNSRHGARRHEKEDYDTLKTCEPSQELMTSEVILPNKGSMTSSTGSSSDQGFHEMAVDAEQSRHLARCSSSYQSIGSQSDSDVDQKQRMLSAGDEDHLPVFDCPEDVDDISQPVNSYKTSSSLEATPLPSPSSVRILKGDTEVVQYTSRQESPLFTPKWSRSPSASPETQENRFSSGSESESLSYHQLGIDFLPSVLAPHRDQTTWAEKNRKNSGEESEPSYSQMALEGPPSSQTPEYQSVWPSEMTPETSPEMMDPIIIDLDCTGLGLNNNKEIPDIHDGNLICSPPQDIIIATALSPQTPAISSSIPAPNSALLRLASTESMDYIDMVDCRSLPQANVATASQVELAPQSPPSPCNDYVLQSELPPASPKENSALN